MRAVKSVDTETAQRMIKETAANHILDIIRSDDEYLEYNYEDYGLRSDKRKFEIGETLP